MDIGEHCYCCRHYHVNFVGFSLRRKTRSHRLGCALWRSGHISRLLFSGAFSEDIKLVDKLRMEDA